MGDNEKEKTVSRLKRTEENMRAMLRHLAGELPGQPPDLNLIVGSMLSEVSFLAKAVRDIYETRP